MNLSNLKPAWQRYKLSNSMQRLDQQELLLMLNQDRVTMDKTSVSVISIIMFIVLTLCVQGG